MFLSILVFAVGGAAALALIVKPVLKTDTQVSERVAQLNAQHPYPESTLLKWQK